MEWQDHLELVDRGTLDTVFQCQHCGEELYTNPEPPHDLAEDWGVWDRIEAGAEIAMAHIEDECESYDPYDPDYTGNYDSFSDD